MRSWEEGLNVNSKRKKRKADGNLEEEEFFACLGTDYLSSQLRHDVVIYKGLLRLNHAHISSFLGECVKPNPVLFSHSWPRFSPPLLNS